MMKKRLCCFVLFLTFLRERECFMPNRASAILETDYTIEDIIREGIVEAFSGQLNGVGNTLEDKVGEMHNNEDLFENKDEEISEDFVAEIIHYSNVAAIEHHGDPVWTFSDEKIMEGHKLLLELRNRLMQIFSGVTPSERYQLVRRSDLPTLHETGEITQWSERMKNGSEGQQTTFWNTPDYRTAREVLGQIFRLISMFYSNTNWAELNNTTIYKQLGRTNTHLLPVAPPSVNTCVSCGVEYSTPCYNNLITTHFLTSGYLGVYASKHDDNSPTEKIGKCRHGGVGDKVFHPMSVPGGMNKISSANEYSPHYFLHHNVALLSIQHVCFYLFDEEFGLRTAIGHEKFSRIFLSQHAKSPMIFVDIKNDVSIQLTDYLLKEDMRVMNISSLRSACLYSDSLIVVIQDASSKRETTSLPIECAAHPVRVVYLVMDQSEGESGRRKKRASLKGLGAYDLIAGVSGGSVYVTDKTNIAAVVDIIKESVSAKPPVTVLKFDLSPTTNDFYVPVDNLVFNLTIRLQSSSYTTRSVMRLYRPDGSVEQFVNSSVATKQRLGYRLEVMKIFNPDFGQWRMVRNSTEALEVDIGANTDLDFFHKFMQTGPGGFGMYPLIGRPIAGDNTTVQVTVPLVDKVGSVDSLLFIDRQNTVINNETLHNIGGRRGKSLFIAHVVIPPKQFMIAIEGKDTVGNTFRRLDSKEVSSLAIQLEVFPTSGTLYVNKTVTIPFRVRNVGGGTTSIDVAITDDKNFAQSPTSRNYRVTSQHVANGTFILKAGMTKGETTTVTISAKASGAPDYKVQYYVRRFTVEEKIIRVLDTTPPICNVTNTSGKCDFGSDVCLCSKYTWEMSAVVGDDGDGLSMVFASGAGNDSNSTTDSFLIGHKLSDGIIHTTLRADCCHQHAKITAVDLAGNVGLCDVTITPGFISPDPKLCFPPTPQSSVSTRQIPCNTTNVTESCMNTTVSNCDNKMWTFEAHIGNGTIGQVNMAPYKAGKNATLSRLNNTIFLSTDCCHHDVYVNLIDFASNTGQCHASVSAPVTTREKTTSSPESSSSSLSVGVIAGVATGGVVVMALVVVLVLYLKSRATVNNVIPLNTKFKT